MNKKNLQTELDKKGILYTEEATNRQLEDLLNSAPVTPPVDPIVPVEPTISVEPTIPVEPVVSIENDPKVKEMKKVLLMNTSGKEVKQKDYFFEGVMLPSFEKTCGKAVDREDLLEVFNKVFKPEDNILFYRQLDKEVYIIIVPIKYSTSIGENNNSITGDFQKHALSFLNEGQVNLESLRSKLERIKTFVKYTDR